MYLLSLLGVLLAFVWTIVYTGASWQNFVDLVSIVILLVVVFPVLVQSGLGKDFNNSFRLTLGKKKEASFKEMKRALEALGLVRKTLWYTSVFICCVSFIVVMHNLDDPANIGPNLAVCILVVAYAAVLNIILLPIEKQLKIRLIEFDETDLAEKETSSDSEGI